MRFKPVLNILWGGVCFIFILFAMWPGPDILPVYILCLYTTCSSRLCGCLFAIMWYMVSYDMGMCSDCVFTIAWNIHVNIIRSAHMKWIYMYFCCTGRQWWVPLDLCQSNFKNPSHPHIYLGGGKCISVCAASCGDIWKGQNVMSSNRLYISSCFGLLFKWECGVYVLVWYWMSCTWCSCLFDFTSGQNKRGDDG